MVSWSQIVLLNRQMLDSPALGIEIASALYRLYPKDFQIDKTLRMIGSRKVLQAIKAGQDPATVALGLAGATGTVLHAPAEIFTLLKTGTHPFLSLRNKWVVSLFQSEVRHLYKPKPRFRNSGMASMTPSAVWLQAGSYA